MINEIPWYSCVWTQQTLQEQSKTRNIQQRKILWRDTLETPTKRHQATQATNAKSMSSIVLVGSTDVIKQMAPLHNNANAKKESTGCQQRATTLATRDLQRKTETNWLLPQTARCACPRTKEDTSKMWPLQQLQQLRIYQWQVFKPRITAGTSNCHRPRMQSNNSS